MTDPSALTTENIIGTLIAGIGIGIYALREYFKTRKAPATSQNGDRVIPGVTIADMQPIRVAEALEGMLELTLERAADEEIMRRAEILAQQMLKQLPAVKRAARSAR